MPVTQPPTGQKIVDELVTEMEAKLYPIVYRTSPPPEYHVYLHPADYREVEALVPLIVADAQLKLNERVEALNKTSRWRTLRESRPPIELPAGGWAIFFHPDANDELKHGELGIVSRLAIPASPQYDGNATVRIGRTVVSGASRRTTTAEEGATSALAPTAGTRRVADAAPSARLTYRDEQGDHQFTMRAEVITIGRGGPAHWVDVRIVAAARVSRQHCRIRRDRDGRFFLKDLSSWGTSVDGARVTADEYELRGDVRIDLADAVTIAFCAQTAAAC
jgi:hypothetical protein